MALTNISGDSLKMRIRCTLIMCMTVMMCEAVFDVARTMTANDAGKISDTETSAGEDGSGNVLCRITAKAAVAVSNGLSEGFVYQRRETDGTDVVRSNYLLTGNTYEYGFNRSRNKSLTLDTKHKIYYKTPEGYGIRTEPYFNYRHWDNYSEDVSAVFSEAYNDVSSDFIRHIYEGGDHSVLADVLNRPRIRKYIPAGQAEEFLDLLCEVALLVCPEQGPPLCRDPKDDYLLYTALAAQANYLVSGDNDLLSLCSIGCTKIISFTDFEAIMKQP